MTDQLKQLDYSNLSTAERILLAQELWDSVYQKGEDLPLTEAEVKEIRRRWDAYEAGKTATSSWQDVKQSIQDQ